MFLACATGRHKHISLFPPFSPKPPDRGGLGGLHRLEVVAEGAPPRVVRGYKNLRFLKPFSKCLRRMYTSSTVSRAEGRRRMSASPAAPRAIKLRLKRLPLSASFAYAPIAERRYRRNGQRMLSPLSHGKHSKTNLKSSILNEKN